MTDLRQSKNYAKYMQSLGWIVDHGAFIKKFWLTSVIKIQHPEKIDLKPLQKYHPFLIKIEPNLSNSRNLSVLRNLKFHPDNWPLIPSKTLILDLKRVNISKDIRYEIRKAERSGASVRLVQGATLHTELENFIKLWHQNAKERGFWVPLGKEIRNLATAFCKNCLLFIAEGAGVLVVINGDTAHYMYAFSTPAGRKNSLPYLVLWEIIKHLQNRKIKHLDLEGLYDERYPDSTKNWQGFTAFKLQWGGKVVEYPGSYSKYFLPLIRTTF